MRQATSPSHSSVLNSWKEIAIYVGRGVRTVQRWERDLGLPVHRPRGKQRSAVLAIPEELDAWIHNTPGRGLGELLLLPGNGETLERVSHSDWEKAEFLREQTRELRKRSALLLTTLIHSATTQQERAERLRAAVRAVNHEARQARAHRAAAARPA